MTSKPFSALDLWYEAMTTECLNRMDRNAREALLCEWQRLYSHRDNPAWVIYDLARGQVSD